MHFTKNLLINFMINAQYGRIQQEIGAFRTLFFRLRIQAKFLKILNFYEKLHKIIVYTEIQKCKLINSC